METQSATKKTALFEEKTGENTPLNARKSISSDFILEFSTKLSFSENDPEDLGCIIVPRQKGKVDKSLFSDKDICVMTMSFPMQFRNVLDNTQIDREGHLLIGSESENLPTVAFLNSFTKKWLKPDQIQLSDGRVMSDICRVPVELFTSTSNENFLPLSGLLLRNYDSPELVDAGQSNNFCIYTAKDLTAIQQSLKDQIHEFFDNFFNDTPSDLNEITKMLRKKE